jgi:hypothetical protein
VAAHDGYLQIDGERVELEPGRYVLVGASALRVVVARSEGLSYFVVGARVEGETG